MLSFSEYMNEGLTYKVNADRIEKFKNIEDYDTETKGDITLYTKDKEAVFNYNSKTKKLTVIKHTWQLMNLDRGF